MYIGALDIGGTKTIAAIVDENGKLLKKQLFPTLISDCHAHLENCVRVLQDLLKQMNVDEHELFGIGVTLPGTVNSEDGVLIYAPYAKWESVPISAYLSNKLNNKNVFCENDVNACAIGEQFFGLGKVYKDFIWITVSTGVGGAVVIGSELVKGAYGFAGELGHLKVEYDIPSQCSCGQYGCLEAHASGTAINEAVKKKALEVPAFAEAFRAAAQKQDGLGCENMARAGNKTALKIYEQAGEYLGRGISYCANILNPQAVIIGGGIAAALDIMLPEIRSAIAKYTFQQMQNFEIVHTPLGYEAALLGAAALVMQNGNRAF